MNSEVMKLSIIIPVYNVEPYIRQCLDSIFTDENNGLPFEVIVVDDGTLDNSMDIVKEYAIKHQNLHVVHQENQGLSVARNTGMSLAQGEYVWFVDSDDWIEQKAIKILLRLIELHPDIDIFTVPSTWKYEDSKMDWVNLRVKDNTLLSGKEYQEAGYHIGAWMFVTKRQKLLDNGIRFYPGILHEDMLWSSEILYVARQMMILNTPLYCYRQRVGSIMNSIKIKSGYDIIISHQQLMKFMDEHVLDEDKPWFRKMNIERIPEAIHVVWHLRHTHEFKVFLSDTKKYRHYTLNECLKFEKSIKGKLKYFVMRFPRINEELRLLKKRFN